MFTECAFVQNQTTISSTKKRQKSARRVTTFSNDVSQRRRRKVQSEWRPKPTLTNNQLKRLLPGYGLVVVVGLANKGGGGGLDKISSWSSTCKTRAREIRLATADNACATLDGLDAPESWPVLKRFIFLFTFVQRPLLNLVAKLWTEGSSEPLS